MTRLAGVSLSQVSAAVQVLKDDVDGAQVGKNGAPKLSVAAREQGFTWQQTRALAAAKRDAAEGGPASSQGVKDALDAAGAAIKAAHGGGSDFVSAAELATMDSKAAKDLAAYAHQLGQQIAATADFDRQFTSDDGLYGKLSDLPGLTVDQLPSGSEAAKALEVFTGWADSAEAHAVTLDGKQAIAVMWNADEPGEVELFDAKGRRFADRQWGDDGLEPSWTISRRSVVFDQVNEPPAGQ
jgi:hypothetical protein